MLDDLNRKGLGIKVDLLLPDERVFRSLKQIIEWRGKSLATRVDNGSEHASSARRAIAQPTPNDVKRLPAPVATG